MVTRRTESEWTAIVEAYEQSGQTQAAWSQEYGINPKTLGAHIHGRGEQKHKQKQVSPVKRSTEEWIGLIEKQRASGVNRNTWCRQHGISPDSMTSAEKRLKTQTQSASEPEWVEFSLHAKTAETPLQREELNGCVKVRGNGLEIEIDAGYPVEKLAILIGRLVRQC